MHTHQLSARLTLPLPVEVVFAFFADAANLGRITPPELRFRIDTPEPIAMHAGAVIDYSLALYGLRFHWRTVIPVWEPPACFEDEQVRGPYARWHHTHRFVPTAAGTEIRDDVRYALPFQPFSLLASPLVRSQVRRIFTFRQKAVMNAFGVPESLCSWDVRV